MIRIFGILRIYGIFTKREKKDRNNENIWNFQNIEIYIYMFCYRRRSGIMGISRILGILGTLQYLCGIMRILKSISIFFLCRRPSGIIGISRILGILPYLCWGEGKDLYGIRRIFGIMRIFGIFRILKFISNSFYKRPSGIIRIMRILGILRILSYLY